MSLANLMYIEVTLTQEMTFMSQDQKMSTNNLLLILKMTKFDSCLLTTFIYISVYFTFAKTQSKQRQS